MSWSASVLSTVRVVLAAGGVAVASVLVLKIAVLVLEPRLTFFPVRAYFDTPAAAGLPFEDVFLRTDDGVRIHGWFIPAAERAGDDAGPTPGSGRGGSSASVRPTTLLFFHGNAENIGGCVDLAALARPAGHNLLLLDYRGYGKSEGRPSERGLYRDGKAALLHLRSRQDVDPGRIVVWGRSIGAAVAVHLAAGDPGGAPAVAGVILESPFTSVQDLLRAGGHLVLYAASRFGTYRFDSAARIGRVAAPVLIIHGTDDEIAPFELGRTLYDLAPGRKELAAIRGGGHNDLFPLHAGELWDAVQRFLASLE